MRKISELSRELTAYTARAALASTTASLDELAGQVTGVVDGAIFTDLGSADGLQAGDQLEVITEEVTRNAAGDVVFRADRVLAVVEIIELSASATKTQLVTSADAAARPPREGDRVRVDAAHAATVRGAGLPTGPLGAASGTSGGEAELERLIMQGDRYAEDRYYAQAVEYYRKALTLQGDSPQILGRLAGALALNRQVMDAEDVAGRLLSAGGEFVVRDVVHNHFMRTCRGVLAIAPGRLSFAASASDHGFAADHTRILSVTQDEMGSVPTLSVEILEGEDDEKGFNFVVPAFLQSIEAEERSSRLADMLKMGVIRSYSGNDEAITNTIRLHRMIVHLVEAHVLARGSAP